tara:strand:+ start:553 stop:960 length:408 start_codon:yes stop_codon:yes gene_type:complete
MLVQVLNQLFEYSNNYIAVREDMNLKIPAFSIIEKDIYGRHIPVILINQKLIPKNINIIAHILSHEWGHHILQHIQKTPPINMPEPEEIQIKENEADTYAAHFIKEYSYDKDDIINFMKDHPFDLDNRLNILCSV